MLPALNTNQTELVSESTHRNCETLPTLITDPRVCNLCAGSFIPDTDGRVCQRCNKIYCAHSAAKVDTTYCQYCFSDFVMEDTIITKEIKSKSLKGNKVFTRTMSARRIVFKGKAWMFAQKRVLEMTDDELLASIEYHHEIYSQMIEEREARSIAKNRAALKRMVRTSTDKFNPVGPSDVIGMRATTVKTTRVTKTHIAATADPAAAMNALVTMLKAKGLSEAEISKALLAMVNKA